MDICNVVYKKFIEFIDFYSLIKNRDKIIVGCSGGQDSLTLLFLLKKLSEYRNIRLVVAHLNHGLREEADEEEEFVRSVALKLELPFFSKKVRIKHKDSLEQQARLYRIKFFKEVSNNTNISKIALGHTKDDLVETTLMRILKGTGLKGLGSIQPMNRLDNLTIIRPLLNVWRNETAEYLSFQGVKYCIDKTNYSLDFFRNKIRLELIPYLEKNFSKDIKEHIFNLSMQSSQDYNFLEERSIKIFKKISCFEDKKISMEKEKFLRLHPSIQALLFRLAYKYLKGDLQKLTYRHFLDFKSILNTKELKILSLPRGVFVSVEKEKLVFFLK